MNGATAATMDAMTDSPRHQTVRPKRIAVVSSSRADYGHIYWPMREMLDHPALEPALLVTGAHLSPEFGLTVREIERDGLPIVERIECLLSADTDGAMGRTLGLATIQFTDALERQRPDLLLLVADRYEMLAPALAALTLRIPIAHIEGGELSTGAIDQQVRNALTMLSHVHLVTTERARQRLLRMGEESERIHRIGAGSLDHLRRSERLDRAALEAKLKRPLRGPVVVVGLHSVTMERETTVEVNAVLEALRDLEATIVFCFPNADAGGRTIIDRAAAFCREHPDAALFTNLDPVTYWSLLARAELMVGNSSSGVMESTSLELPAVNIGKRQHGRERGENVIDAPAEQGAIRRAIQRGLDPAFRESVAGVVSAYGDGHAAERLAGILARLTIDQSLLEKQGIPDPAPSPRSPRFRPART